MDGIYLSNLPLSQSDMKSFYIRGWPHMIWDICMATLKKCLAPSGAEQYIQSCSF